MVPKFKCNCGEYINCSEIPNPNGYYFAGENDISDDEYEEIAKDGHLTIFDRLLHMLKCPSCGRLVVFWDQYHENPEFFTSEGFDEPNLQAAHPENPKE